MKQGAVGSYCKNATANDNIAVRELMSEERKKLASGAQEVRVDESVTQRNAFSALETFGVSEAFYRSIFDC